MEGIDGLRVQALRVMSLDFAVAGGLGLYLGCS